MILALAGLVTGSAHVLSQPGQLAHPFPGWLQPESSEGADTPARAS